MSDSEETTKKAAKKPKKETALAVREQVIDETNPVDKILKTHIILGGAAGLIPTPLIDLASITALHVNMIKELSDHYEVPFKEHLCKNIIGALLSGAGALVLGQVAAASLLKSIPVLGTVGGMLTMPIMAGASTYALGKIFIEHFEGGGTLLDFSADTAKAHFKREYQVGKKVAADLKDEILRKNKTPKDAK